MQQKLLSIKEKISLFSSNQYTPEQNISDCLKRISEQQPKINAFTYVNKTEALLQAKSASQTSQQRGSLQGIAFTAKDHFFVKGLPSSEGAKQTVIPSAPYTDILIQKLIDAGAICIGKANQPEYSKSNFTDNKLYGRTNNPWNNDYTCGGSSGGDAAAVASGCCDLGVGGDSGGSLRVPANFCGLYGLLPSPGIVESSLSEFVGNSFLKEMGSPGVVTRSIEDLELVFEVIRSSQPISLYSEIDPSRRTNQFLCLTEVAGVPCADEISDDLRKTVKKLEKLGYQAVFQNQKIFDSTIPIFYLLAGQAGLRQEDLIRNKLGKPRDLSSESPTVQTLRKQIDIFMPPLSVDGILEAIYFWRELRERSKELFRQFDFILSPVAATSALRHGTEKVTIATKEFQTHELFHFSRFANVLGLPAVAFPTSHNKENLPLGLQIIGNRYHDSYLIRLIQQIQRTSP